MQPIGRSTALAVIAGTALLLGGAGAAEAEALSFSMDSNNITPQAKGFAQFNPSLGTLTEVDIALNNSVVDGHASTGVTGGEGGDSTLYGWALDLDVTYALGALFIGPVTGVRRMHCHRRRRRQL